MKRELNKINARLSLLLKRKRLFNKPLHMMVEPTNHCNLSCPLCPTGNGTLNVPRGFMDYNKYERLIDDLSPELQTILLWGFGEPLLHPDICKMVAKAHRNKITTKISTNGQCFKTKEFCKELVESGLDQIRVSLDGLSDETLRVYRKGASLKPILTGLEYIKDAKEKLKKKTPLILLQFIMMKHNQHELKRLPEFAKKLGVVWRVKTVSKGTDDSFLPDPKLSRYKLKEDSNGKNVLVPIEKRPTICPYPWLWAHVNWDGSVVPCCKDPHREHDLGNSFEDSFMNVWNSEKYISFRENYLKEPLQLKRCSQCDHVFNGKKL